MDSRQALIPWLGSAMAFSPLVDAIAAASQLLPFAPSTQGSQNKKVLP
jgi:hypothetical protein